jgi:hypothetical protein
MQVRLDSMTLLRGTYEEMVTAVCACLEHHFNIHKLCGNWCKAAKGTEQEIRSTGLQFRCKQRNQDMYLFMKKHHEDFMEDSKLCQLFHE